MASAKNWVITTGGNRPVADIAKDLAKVGLSVGQVMEEIGCITGTASDEDVPKLRNVRGVTDVSPDMPIDIGPPGAPETW